MNDRLSETKDQKPCKQNSMEKRIEIQKQSAKPERLTETRAVPAKRKSNVRKV